MVAAIVPGRNEKIPHDHISRRRAMPDDIFGDHTVQTRPTTTERPIYVLILGVIGDEDLAFSCDNSHLQDVACGKTIRPRNRTVTTTLNVST
jgi:hypothetical protein